MTEQLPLYALRTAGPDTFQMAKFAMPDFNVEATYNLARKGTGWTCDCPANGRSVVLKPCKHKRMMPLMLGAVNLPRFFEPTAGRWIEVAEVAPGLPTGDEVASEASRDKALTVASYTELAEGANVAEEFSKLLEPNPLIDELPTKPPTPAPAPSTGGIRRR